MDKNQMMEQLRDYVDETTDMTAQEFLMEMPEDLSIWLEENLMADMVEAVNDAGYELEYSTQVGRGSVEVYEVDEDDNWKGRGNRDYESETDELRSLVSEGNDYDEVVAQMAKTYVEMAEDYEDEED